MPSLVDSAEQALRDWLATTQCREGDWLASEQHLATMLGVSRSTLRSALQRLDESGELVRRHGSGTFVGRAPAPRYLEERLERLESYSSVAKRRGLTLSAVQLSVERRSVRGEGGEELGLSHIAEALIISRTLATDSKPIAVMVDVVHPAITLADEPVLREALERGHTMLDLLMEAHVPVTFASTRVHPRLLEPCESIGNALALGETTAVLQLDELIYAGTDRRVAFSRGVFAPGAIEVTVTRSRETPLPLRNIKVAETRCRSRGKSGHRTDSTHALATTSDTKPVRAVPLLRTYNS